MLFKVNGKTKHLKCILVQQTRKLLLVNKNNFFSYPFSWFFYLYSDFASKKVGGEER